MKPNAPNALFNTLPAPLRRHPVGTTTGVVALAALILFLAFGRGAVDASATAFHEVRRGDFTVSIVEGGALTAVDEIGIRSEVEGTARIIFIVPEGSYVKKGDLLVELDSSQAQDQVNLQQINVEKAQFALIQAEQQLKIQESANESDIRAAELKLKFAKLDLQKFLQGASLVDLLEASNNVAKTEAQLEVARNTFDWSIKLATNGYETKRTVDSDRLSVLNNQYQLLIASNTVWMLQAFDLPKQREQFESNVHEGEEELKRVKAQSARRLAQFEADLLTQSNTLALNIRKLDRDRKNLEATKRTAPQDGLVVYPVGENRFSSESLIEEGAVVRNRQELIKLPDISRMKVTVKVHESHVNMVRPGLPAFVVLDSMPDQRFRGTVEKVALLPDTQARWGNPNLKVYNTDVHIADPLPGVKPGVSARAEIIITNIADALSIPIQAVTTLAGRQVAYVLNGNKPTPVPVEVGLYNTKFIQITAGLQEGNRVLLSPPFDTQEKDLEGAVLAADEKARVVVTNAPSTRGPRSAAALEGIETSRRDANAAPRPAEAGNAGNVTAAGPDGARDRAGRRGGLSPEEALKQFDQDGDGTLSDAERQAMQAQMRQRGGGRTNRPGFNREAMMKEFDKDGDGQLSEEEQQAMREEFQRRSGGAAPGAAGRRSGGDGGTPRRDTGAE